MTFAYTCVLIAMFLPLLCAAYAKKLGGFNFQQHNGDPRAFLAQATGRAARADAAQKNSFENFAPFAAAVIIAHVAGDASQAVINFWSGLFIVSRIAYIWFYLNDQARARSAAYTVGLAATVALFISAY